VLSKLKIANFPPLQAKPKIVIGYAVSTIKHCRIFKQENEPKRVSKYFNLNIMKTFYLITLLSALCGISNHAISQNLIWAKKFGGTNDDRGISSAIDVIGNVYTTGYFQGTADFDPGPGIFNLVGSGAYISKLDASGNFLWAKVFKGAFGFSVSLDANGNVYTTGTFSDTVDFDPGIGTYNMISSGIVDVFISKLDLSGNFIWARRIGGVSIDRGISITVDINENVYTTGSFGNQVDFDPGPGIYNLTCSGYDVFVSKLDASGNFVWAKQMGGLSDEYGFSIALDSSDNVYTTGTFVNTADFDPGVGVYNLIADSINTNDIFISKLDVSGNFIWAKKLGGKMYDYVNAITIDAGGNVYTTGAIQDTADFDPGPGTYNLFENGAFISKLDSSGNFLWANQIVSSAGSTAYSITTDVNGNVYTTGVFTGTADFDPGIGTYNLIQGLSSGDVFILQLNSLGNFISASQFKGSIGSFGTGFSISVDANGNIYTTGRFSSLVDFDPGSSIFNLTTTGNEDIFVLKLNNLTGTQENLNSLDINNIYPNPAASNFTIDFVNNINHGIVELYNVMGEKVFGETIFNLSKKEISLKNISEGIYFVKVFDGEKSYCKKLIVKND
jgi:hypothetical protein